MTAQVHANITLVEPVTFVIRGGMTIGTLAGLNLSPFAGKTPKAFDRGWQWISAEKVINPGSHTALSC